MCGVFLGGGAQRHALPRRGGGGNCDLGALAIFVLALLAVHHSVHCALSSHHWNVGAADSSIYVCLRTSSSCKPPSHRKEEMHLPFPVVIFFCDPQFFFFYNEF